MNGKRRLNNAGGLHKFRSLFLLWLGLVIGLTGGIGNWTWIQDAKAAGAWEMRSSNTNVDLFGVAYGNGHWVAVSKTSYITSTDGITWTKKYLNNGYLFDVIFANNRWIAVGENSVLPAGGLVITSEDGENWSEQRSVSDNQLDGIAYNGSLFVVVGENGTLLTSPDGVSWTDRSASSGFGNASMYRVAYGNGMFVAVGDKGAIYTSPDGMVWTSKVSGTADFLYGVDYGNGKFVAVGGKALLTSSDNGATWKAVSTDVNFLDGVTFGGNKFLVVGDGGYIISSNNGDEWTTEYADGASEFLDASFGGGRFVAVGMGGALVTYFSSGENRLSDLKVSHGTLAPSFSPGVNSYSSFVSHSVSMLEVTPTLVDPSATIKINGAAVPDQIAKQVPLAVGVNNIQVDVTAQNGDLKSYTITVSRAVPSNNALLSNLGISSGPFEEEAFDSNSFNYSAKVNNSTASITVTPTASDPGAKIKVKDAEVTSGATSPAIALHTGENVIPVVVTAEDGTSTKTYTITVTRAKSSNADLSSLSTSSGALNPVFQSGTQTYTVDVLNNITSIAVSPVAADLAVNKITVNATEVASGATSQAIALSTGENVITVEVNAEDGVTTKTYTLKVTRAKSGNADLSSLTLSAGALNPDFSSGRTDYTVNVDHSVTSIAVTPTTADSMATVRVNGADATSGTASQQIQLNVGDNTISIEVTAEDGTTKTYKVTVFRAKSNDATLRGLALSEGTLNPVFEPEKLSYGANVPNTTESITVTPALAEGAATVTVAGEVVSNGNASQPIKLKVGSNIVPIIVTAANGITTRTYTIEVTRAASSNALLSKLELRGAALSPSFSPDHGDYTASVTNVVYAVYVTPTLADVTAHLKINNQTINSGEEIEIPLIVGDNLVAIEITAADRTLNTYILKIARADLPSNADLISLTLSAGTLSPAFDPGITRYATSVANTVDSISFVPTLADSSASLTVNGHPATNGTPITVGIKVGDNPIVIRVKALRGETKEYVITVTRSAPQGGGDQGNGNGGTGGSGGGMSGNPSSGAPTTSPKQPTDQDELSFIDDQGNKWASGRVKTENGLKSTDAVADDLAMLKKASSAQTGVTFYAPVLNKSDAVGFEFGASLLETLAAKKAVVSVASEFGKYNLPIQLVDWKGAISSLGNNVSLKDVKVRLEMKRIPGQNTAAGRSLTETVPWVDFSLMLSSGGQTREIQAFNGYVQREIYVNKGTNRSHLTTSVLVMQDGSLRHVPTVVKEENDRYVAVINSLTNGKYTVIDNRKTFEDVKGHWAQKSIENLASRLIVRGVSTANFAPNQSISRAGFISMLVRALGLQSSDHLATFTDVKESGWYHDAVMIGVSYGLVQGYDNGQFRPENPITRQEAMAIMVKALKLTGHEVRLTPEETEALLSTFRDRSEIRPWAREATALQIREGIVVGDQGKLMPNQAMTRAETALMVERVLRAAGLID
ncbi:cadherin-like beta sandwich domain-containing protein [Paenibacillus puldeungensis]|uniref:Cadherin-like beta sandwich domain-containing protein n=1 Tax=Paenibacillus puldeungensis TaxID=696536 RepID=A0ABW3RT28_9BACL